ncbi:MAG: ABC transporter permease [Rhodopseudomonas sp.]|nr:ABC transporter permease [Rhodopseudomonas sp.]
MPELIIEAGHSERHYWRELWRYRELFAVLAWRDLSVLYKQTAIGVLWALMRPVLTMVVFTIVFGRIARLPSEGGAPYPVMVFAGMLPWMFFANALTEASNSLLANGNLIGKVYFPRIVVPAAAVVSAFADFLIGLLVLFGLMAVYRFAPDGRIVLLPVFAVVACLTSLGPGLWIATLNVKYRDFRYVIPFIVQFGLYISPVGFSAALIPEQWRLVYSLNPMVGVIDGFRWCILGGESRMYWPGFAVSMAVTAFFLWFGIRRFRKTEMSLADLL